MSTSTFDPSGQAAAPRGAAEQANAYLDRLGGDGRIAFALSFFLRPDWQAHRGAVVSVYETMLDRLRPLIRLCRTERMARALPFDLEAERLLPWWLEHPLAARSWRQLHLTSHPGRGAAGPWGLQFVAGSEHDPQAPAALRILVPATEAALGPAGWKALFVDSVCRLPCVSAMAAYTLVPIDLARQIAGPPGFVRAALARYECLDCGDLFAARHGARHALVGLGWLNYLSDALVPESARRRLESLSGPMAVETLGLAGDGLLLQIGAAPVLGDRNRSEDLAAYRGAWAVLGSDSLVQDHDFCLMGAERTARWLNRFER